MSHLTRVLLLFPLLLLCALSSPAADVVARENAKELRDKCRDYIAMAPVARPGAFFDIPGLALNANKCIGYIEGAIDGLNIKMAASGVDPKSLKACMPKEATTDELVRVFLKYIYSHPGELSNMAADVVWRAIITSYPCPAK